MLLFLSVNLSGYFVDFLSENMMMLKENLLWFCKFFEVSNVRGFLGFEVLMILVQGLRF